MFMRSLVLPRLPPQHLRRYAGATPPLWLLPALLALTCGTILLQPERRFGAGLPIIHFPYLPQLLFMCRHSAFHRFVLVRAPLLPLLFNNYPLCLPRLLLLQPFAPVL